MKRFLVRHGSIVTAFALFMSTLIINSACLFSLNQPETPETVMKLRKF